MITDSILQFDTTSIYTLSFKVFNNSIEINNADYILNASNATIVWKNKPKADSVTIQYKKLPYNFNKKYAHKNIDWIFNNSTKIINPFEYKPVNKLGNLFDLGNGLQYTGNYTRGISIGNSQSLVSNSNFNLQLNGKINNDVSVEAAITDNNIPIQPDGNTAQLQEFDKIYILLKQQKNKLLVGDMQLINNTDKYVNYNKRLQGLQYSRIDTFKNKVIHDINAAATIGKGKYARKIFNGSEGNQGPYRLVGNNGETFIIILANTERVYVDGELMHRGENADYVIDYNIGEITFTANKLITKDKRIIVEYQYAERYYFKSTIALNDNITLHKFKINFSAISDNDAKNKPQESFIGNEKSIMAKVGDSIQNAFFNTAQVLTYDINRILYRKIDTIINGIADSIFVLSNNKDSTLYAVAFSYVGAGKGDYNQSKQNTNGRVYAFVGKKAGAYLPVVLLITPKKQSIVSTKLNYSLKNGSISTHVALSNKDVNLFSNIDNKDNTGLAYNASLNNAHTITLLNSNYNILYNIDYEWISKKFTTLENFRTIEFIRDWNLNSINIKTDQIQANAGLQLGKLNLWSLQYKINVLNIEKNYSGQKHETKFTFTKSSWKIESNSSILNSNSTFEKTNFIRPQISINKTFNNIKTNFGANYYSEKNYIKNIAKDTLNNTSFKNDQFKFYINSTDSAKIFYKYSIESRNDFGVRNNTFIKTAAAINNTFSSKINSLKNQQLELIANYRTLQVFDTILIHQKSEKIVLGRLNYDAKLLDNFIDISSNYQISSGNELKREFVYVKVANGQGHYSWVDLNADGIQQINEFVETDFQSNKSYDKLLVPTQIFIKANEVLWNFSANIEPANFFEEKYSAKKWMNKFILICNSQYNRKTINSPKSSSYVPFSHIIDSNIVSENKALATQLFFNRSVAAFGADIGFSTMSNKALLTYGFETKNKQEWSEKLRWLITKGFSNQITLIEGIKSNDAKYVITQSYKINYFSIEPKMNALFKNFIRTSIALNYKQSINNKELGADSAFVKKLIFEIRVNGKSNGVFTSNLTFAQVKYNKSTNTNTAYTILEGLQIGQNYIWQINYEKRLASNIEMSIQYEGRKTGKAAVVNTGRMSIRAFF